MRLVHLVLGPRHPLWLLFYSDDGDITGSGREMFRTLLYSLVVLEVLSFPLAWKKTGGGLAYDWIGYWLDVQTFEVGLSERRAAWVVDWLRSRAAEGCGSGNVS